MRSWWSSLRDRARPERNLLDGLAALVIGAVCLLSFFAAERTDSAPREADALGAALVGLAAASLAWRRRWPVPVLAAVSSVTVAVLALGYPDSGLPFVVLVALYTVASRCDRRVTVGATAALLLVVVLVVADSADMDVGSVVGTLAVFGLAAVWGDRRQVREAYAEQLELRAAERERERLEAARRAAAEERLRIARELHDVVAHTMSVVAVQSGVGAHLIDSRPDEAKRILETISRTSRDSLNEMRRLLGMLRTGPDAAAEGADELAPAPGLGAIDDLVARVTEAGVPVEATVEGERADLPAGVELAAYRIVQEALTNVVKHAGPARARVTVRYDPGAVRVEVVDDGRGAAAGGGAGGEVGGGNGTGHGLVGMRERASLYGGDLEAGPRPGGGYRVAATLRYDPS